MSVERKCSICDKVLANTERYGLYEDLCRSCAIESMERRTGSKATSRQEEPTKAYVNTEEKMQDSSVNVDVSESDATQAPQEDLNLESEPSEDWNPMRRPWREGNYLPLQPFEKRVYYFLRTLMWPGSSWFFGISVWGIALNIWEIPFLIAGAIIGGLFALICALLASASKSDTDFYFTNKGISMVFTPPAVVLFILALIIWGVRIII